jgi:NAD(P)-dependent dehydrogenase (short-subunit alcohol dehydrogenase family)
MLVAITGASKGIGFELARQFAVRKNCTVIVISRNVSSLTQLAKKHKNIYVVKADLTSVSGRKKVLTAVATLKKPLDILINNAGHIVNKAFTKITAKELRDVYATNVFAPFELIQLLTKHMNKKGSHIVNISSMGGFQGSSKFPGLSAYSSSKAAIAGLSECLAEELKPENISVNCLAIGAVQTEMLSKAFPGYKAPLQPVEMAEFIAGFALNGHKFFNGKILPVASTTP